MTVPAKTRLTVLKLHETLTGRHILKRLDELNRSQWLCASELLSLQRRKLQRVIEYAYRYVPFYRRLFDEVGFRPGDLNQDINALSRIPVLTKSIIKANFDSLLTSEPARRRELSRVMTSGSTGEPLTFMQDNDYRDNFTADIQRHLGWAGWKLGQLHAYIWGADFEVSAQKALRTRLLDWTWNRFLTNAYLLCDRSLAAFTARVRRRRPKLLFGYASSLNRFAEYVHGQGYDDITFNGVFSSAEVLLQSVRRRIETTFRCKVFDRYGTKELGGVGCECGAHTGLHISAENNFVEVVNAAGHPAQPGEVGDIIVTNLNNLGMPFIRYGIDDLGAWSLGSPCPCGRAAPMLSALQGRLVETFRSRDGRTPWAGFAGAAYGALAHPAIRQFQVVQKSLDLIVMRLVRAGEIPQSVLDQLVLTIHRAFGEEVRVEFEFPDQIPRPLSGKHRYAISELEDND